MDLARCIHDLRMEIRMGALQNEERFRNEKIARQVAKLYVATFSVNFTDWMGKAAIFVRHELARYSLADNLRCETLENHIGLLDEFANRGNAVPDTAALYQVHPAVNQVRQDLRKVENNGLYGLALMTFLENTSLDFIPVLEVVAQTINTDLAYTSVHGVADVAHSEQFVKALEAEMGAGYTEEQVGDAISGAYDSTGLLIKGIFARK